MTFISTGVAMTRQAMRSYGRMMLTKQALARRDGIGKYFAFYGRWPNLRQPRRFSEKLLWLSLYYRDSLIPPLVDKWTARELVAQRAGADILNELYGVWDDAGQIPFDQLPHQFVLKVTGGCGWNILCPDKSRLNIAETVDQLSRWQKTNYFNVLGEWQYQSLQSRIIAERFMVDPDFPDRSPADVKVFCFNGEPKVIGLSTDRRGRVRHDFFDCDWHRVDYGISTKPRCEIEPPRPENLPRMLEICRQLSAGFPFVRVDLYQHLGRIVFGEMTFSPNAGNMPLNGPGADELWGSWLTLPGT